MICIGFILTSLVVILIPGTGVIYTVSRGISGSKRDSILAALGCTAGIIPHLMASVFGISALLHTSAVVFSAIKIVGIVYLLYLGYGLITTKNGIEVKAEDNKQTNLKIIGKGILLNLLNPKLTLFFLSFIPQFLGNPSSGYTSKMLMLSAVFMGLTLIVFVLYGLLANYFKQLFIKSPKIMRRIQQGFGIILIGFAAKLAFSSE